MPAAARSAAPASRARGDRRARACDRGYGARRRPPRPSRRSCRRPPKRRPRSTAISERRAALQRHQADEREADEAGRGLRAAHGAGDPRVAADADETLGTPHGSTAGGRGRQGRPAAWPVRTARVAPHVGDRERLGLSGRGRRPPRTRTGSSERLTSSASILTCAARSSATSVRASGAIEAGREDEMRLGRRQGPEQLRDALERASGSAGPPVCRRRRRRWLRASPFRIASTAAGVSAIPSSTANGSVTAASRNAARGRSRLNVAYATRRRGRRRGRARRRRRCARPPAGRSARCGGGARRAGQPAADRSADVLGERLLGGKRGELVDCLGDHRVDERRRELGGDERGAELVAVRMSCSKRLGAGSGWTAGSGSGSLDELRLDDGLGLRLGSSSASAVGSVSETSVSRRLRRPARRSTKGSGSTTAGAGSASTTARASRWQTGTPARGAPRRAGAARARAAPPRGARRQPGPSRRSLPPSPDRRRGRSPRAPTRSSGRSSWPGRRRARARSPRRPGRSRRRSGRRRARRTCGRRSRRCRRRCRRAGGR